MNTQPRSPVVTVAQAPPDATPPRDGDDERRTKETQRIETVHTRRLALVRHRVAVLAAQVGAQCDRMLRSVHQADREAWRAAIGAALLASRLVVAAAEAAVETDAADPEARLAALEARARTGFGAVAEAMSIFTRVVPVSLEDELLVADARRIRASAAGAFTPGAGDVTQLTATPIEPGMTAPGAAAGDDADGPSTVARILVADDTEGVRRLLERALVRMGHTVISAGDGRKALEIAGAQPVDLVITDMHMPEMTGLELLTALKASPTLNHLPVIVLSSDTEMEKVVECLELGAEDYVAKPFQATILGARVQASLTRKRLRDVELDIVRRAGQISAAAEAVDRDAYVPGTLAPVARGTDHLANLARVFERMVLNLKSREDRLGRRLEHLRSEVGSITTVGVQAAHSSPRSPLATGAVLGGRFDILGLLGAGGMGVVYHAMDRELHEEVAIKVVREDVVKEDPTLVDRLKTELRLARKLSHPNILRAHDLGEAGGSYFISMEYVKGISLHEMLDQRGRVSVEAAIAVGTQLADALAAAHAQRIIHRDIKPANLLMDEQGVLKVTDFGLAKVVAAERGHTQRGIVVGTPFYMAPEQLMGGTLDARSDLFAAGIVLYECLTGRVPFDADSPVTLMARMIDEDFPPLASLVPDAPRALQDLVTRMLRLSPDARVQTASEVSRLLSEIEMSGIGGG